MQEVAWITTIKLTTSSCLYQRCMTHPRGLAAAMQCSRWGWQAAIWDSHLSGWKWRNTSMKGPCGSSRVLSHTRSLRLRKAFRSSPVPPQQTGVKTRLGKEVHWTAR